MPKPTKKERITTFPEKCAKCSAPIDSKLWRLRTYSNRKVEEEYCRDCYNKYIDDPQTQSPSASDGTSFTDSDSSSSDSD